MYAINVVRFLNKSFSAKVKTAVSSLKYLQRNYKAKQPSSFDLRARVKDDVVIFRFEDPKFFLGLNLISAVQCGFWTYLGVFFFQSLDSPAFNFQSDKFWGKVLEKERQYSSVLCAVSLFFGWVILIGSGFYTMRSIRKIILHKDGRYVTLVTYNLPGYNSTKIPLNNLSSLDHRTKAKKYIPIKIKNTYFYYLIDVRGEFSNPDLFDFTVGVRRGFSR